MSMGQIIDNFSINAALHTDMKCTSSNY